MKGRVAAVARTVVALWLGSAVQARAELPTERCTEPVRELRPACADASVEGLTAVAILWAGPHLALERAGSRAFAYAPHPYAEAEPGVLRLGGAAPRLGNVRPPPTPLGAGYRGTLTLGVGIVPGWVGRADFALRLRTPTRVEAAVELSGLQGPPDGPLSRSLLGRYGLQLRFAQSPRLSVLSGVGGLSRSDASGTRGGGYVDYALRWYPGAPWSLEAGLAIGGLGGAFYGRLWAHAGVSMGHFELLFGYDHEALRGDSAPLRLGGPRLSLRAWL